MGINELLWVLPWYAGFCWITSWLLGSTGPYWVSGNRIGGSTKGRTPRTCFTRLEASGNTFTVSFYLAQFFVQTKKKKSNFFLSFFALRRRSASPLLQWHSKASYHLFHFIPCDPFQWKVWEISLSISIKFYRHFCKSCTLKAEKLLVLRLSLFGPQMVSLKQKSNTFTSNKWTRNKRHSSKINREEEWFTPL